MSYAPSPRPTFDGPTHIPYESAARHLWGDQQSGEVADWIYVSSQKIHQLVFGLAPGMAFRHSPAYRTIFGADVVYHVLSGTMVLCNPETGEMHRFSQGESAFFRRDTWHNAFSYSTDALRVLEFFAPPPSQGTSGAYAQARPYLEEPKYQRDELLERWPMARQDVQQTATIHPIRDADVLWRLEGREQPILVGILVSTEHLTVGSIELLPGQRSEPQRHGGDESLYVLEGTLNVRVPENGGQRWFELKPGDGFYLPEGTVHQYYNVTGQPARLLFGVAPRYQAD
jgi:quercetin dioxygenase-like cupin family protein